jgi:tRNA1Val (adenine37-N6)-methyltransferase
MSNQPFQFKQFSIAQDRCAAKIGTDGVLLGSWTSLKDNPNSILDIGTGTGVIALMLAQRSDAQTIDALELDDNAYEQATENFEASPWGDRLFCYHAHLYEFATEMDAQYDLIVSNPPFYEAPSLPLASLPEGDNNNNMSEARKNARFDDAMPFELLLGAVQNLLSEDGRFAVILPFHREQEFIQLAERGGLLPVRITRVQGTPTSETKRSMMEFCFRESVKSNHTTNNLIVEKSRHDYTSEYISLVQDFYLKM